MKTHIKNFLAASLLMAVLVSCGTGREITNHPAQCGFGEEASIEQTKEVDHKISPAANRNINAVEDIDVPTESGAIATTSSKDKSGIEDSKIKSSRKHAKLGSEKRKKIKDAITAYKESKKRGGGGVELILLIILAIILPPLAVAIFEGITGRFWLVLILWILGWGVGWWLLGAGGALFSLVAVILALLIVLGVW